MIPPFVSPDQDIFQLSYFDFFFVLCPFFKHEQVMILDSIMLFLWQQSFNHIFLQLQQTITINSAGAKHCHQGKLVFLYFNYYFLEIRNNKVLYDLISYGDYGPP